jgi:hypothetical protein
MLWERKKMGPRLTAGFKTGAYSFVQQPVFEHSLVPGTGLYVFLTLSLPSILSQSFLPSFLFFLSFFLQMRKMKLTG